MNTNALRQKILDLAIHGKLVKQDPADEPASVMLEKLRAEKEAKIAAGEIKRSKNDSYIFKYTGTSGESKTDDNPEGLEHNRHYEKFSDGRVKDIEDEIPFAVPEGWAWCRLPEVCRKPITDGTHNSPPNSASGDFLYITAKNIKNLAICLDDATYVSKEIHESIYSRCSPELNDVLLTKDGTIGEVAVNNLNYPFSMLSSVALIKPSNGILPWFLAYILISDLLQNKMKKNAKGSALKRIILAQINNFIIPLPPLAEQKRIVTAIEAIFTQIDLMEQNKVDLQTAVKQAKSKILDLAIHGKLVPQDPADEPASVMLERLRAEKEAKIVAGEMKRGKNDSYIYKNSTDNCYYEKFDDGTEVAIEIDSIIPEAWVWCYFSDIADVINGKNQSKVKEGAGKYPIYGSGGIIGYANDYICPENCTIIGRKGSINNPIFTEEKFWNVDTAFGLVPSSIILARYLFYFCKSFDFTSLDSSTTLPSLTKTNIQHILFPLPPLAVQQRILDKIDELFNQLDKIALNIV